MPFISVIDAECQSDDQFEDDEIEEESPLLDQDHLPKDNPIQEDINDDLDSEVDEKSRRQSLRKRSSKGNTNIGCLFNL